MTTTADQQSVADETAAPDSRINTDDGRQYWEGVTADLDGMLGGFPYVSKVDLQGSKNFLAKLGIGNKQGLRTVPSALEGGAGIGRITRGLLLDVAEEVDVVEPIAKFTKELADVSGVREVFNVGLEEWRPDADVSYDLVWIQWCLGHLTDDEVVQFLKRCREVLTPETGVIVVKENLSGSGIDIFDELDSSVTREDGKFHKLFDEAGLHVLRTELQRGMPKGLFQVRSYALR